MSLFVKLASWLPRDWIDAFASARGRAPWLKRATKWIPDLIRTQEGVIQRGVLRGLRFNAGGSAAGFLLGTHDPHTQIAFELLVKPNMVVYDVGANVGFTAVLAAQLTGSKGRVICFEPQPSCVQMIRHNAAINGFANIEVRCEALAGSDGLARFLVTSDSTFSRLTEGDANKTDKEIEVTTRQLDSFLTEGSLPPPDLIKIDVEGAEASVLNGAMVTLRNAKPVLLIELHGTREVVANALTKAGYTAKVVGNRNGILAAHRNALVIGVPPGRSDLDNALNELTHGSDGE